MAQLECLTNEILHDILSRLHRQDLVRSSHVCQLMRNSSQSLLYRRLCLTSRPSPGMHVPRLHMFVRSLLIPGGERIATCVRNLTIECDNYGTKQTSGDLPLFTEALSRLGLEKTQSISEDVHMILLHLIPKLHTLHLFPPQFNDSLDQLMGSFRALRPISALPIALQSLREFHWCSKSYYARVGTEALLVLLRLPNISFIRNAIFSAIRKAAIIAAIAQVALYPKLSACYIDQVVWQRRRFVP